MMGWTSLGRLRFDEMWELCSCGLPKRVMDSARLFTACGKVEDTLKIGRRLAQQHAHRIKGMLKNAYFKLPFKHLRDGKSID